MLGARYTELVCLLQMLGVVHADRQILARPLDRGQQMRVGERQCARAVLPLAHRVQRRAAPGDDAAHIGERTAQIIDIDDPVPGEETQPRLTV